MRMRCLRRQTDFDSELPGRGVCGPFARSKVEGPKSKVRSAGFSLRQLAFLLLALVLLLPGCMRHEQRADLVIVNGIEPETLDPALVLGVAEMRIVTSIFEGLTRNDPKTSDPIPGLAERWDISPDGRVYTFHLRTNL